MSTSSKTPRSEIAVALGKARSAFLGIGLISGVVNILTLTGSFFMLQVYDRVLTSKSVPTLVGLAVLAGSLYIFQGILDAIRNRVLTRIGGVLDEQLGNRIYDLVVSLPLKSRSDGDGLQPLRDFDQVRNYLSGPGPTAFFDLPWIPLYLGICYIFHPLIGVVATVGALLLIIVTLTTEFLTAGPSKDAASSMAKRNSLAEAGRRNAEVLRSMGFHAKFGKKWASANADFLRSQRSASDVAGGLGSMSRILRMILQSGVLAVGAWLVLQQEATGGIMIAGSIVMSRALAPIELAIAHWRGFVGARQGWKRLGELLVLLPQETQRTELPVPKKVLQVANVSVVPPGSKNVEVQDASFVLKAGQGVGVIGPSGSGKTSLIRSLVGVWVPARGSVRLDGAAFDQWSIEALGAHIGYLPQDVELLAGSVAENISRFEDNPDAKDVISAAKIADIHEMVLNFADGYDTEIGEGGASLSAGQRQRIALARALYKNPFLVVLDEPNSNLDGEGEAALIKAILSVRERDGIVVIVAHRPSALSAVDNVIMMKAGKIQAFGPKEKVFSEVLQTKSSGKSKTISGRSSTNKRKVEPK